MKNEEKKILGLTLEEIQRQTNRPYDVDPQTAMGPIKEDFGTLEPVIEGAKKIVENPELKELARDILTSKYK